MEDLQIRRTDCQESTESASGKMDSCAVNRVRYELSRFRGGSLPEAAMTTLERSTESDHYRMSPHQDLPLKLFVSVRSH